MSPQKERIGCPLCEHFDLATDICAAFAPNQIPMPIVEGQIGHTEPMFGQENDIIFKRRDPGITRAELIRQAKEKRKALAEAIGVS